MEGRWECPTGHEEYFRDEVPVVNTVKPKSTYSKKTKLSKRRKNR